jgi:alpha-galactosidase
MRLRKQLAGSAILIMACGGSFAARAMGTPAVQDQPYVSGAQAASKFISENFVPDGDLDKPAWRKAQWIMIHRGAFDQTIYPQAETEAASLWTKTDVYFAFRGKYTTLNLFEGKHPDQDFWKLWERDVVEVFLNPEPARPNHYYEFEVAPNNLWIDLEINLEKSSYDPKWNSGFAHATRIDAQKHVWTCEMRIPARALGVLKPLAANSEWRLNFFRADGPGGAEPRRMLSWSLVHSPTRTFHTPASFGVLRFVK